MKIYINKYSNMKNFKELNFEKNGNGLIPAIIQDVKSLKVLMLGYMSRGSLAITMEKGLVTFYSRSRKVLWTKGETSGNYLKVISIDIDCDGDTLLIMAEPTGNICHKGTFSCFGDEFQLIETEGISVPINDNSRAQTNDNSKAEIKNSASVSINDSAREMIKGGGKLYRNPKVNAEVISNLISTIRERHENMPEGSYTAQLFRKGTAAIAQKVGEEAVEVVVEAVKGDRERLVYELADLAYHTLVLMENAGISTGDLSDELNKRM